MGRPRKDQQGPSAVERMRGAFWALLEEKPYSAITVRLIADRANVNHNTFYYHFQNIDEMAARFFEENIPVQLVDLMAEVATGRPIDLDVIKNEVDIEEHYCRVRMVVRNGSFDLATRGRELLIEHWLGRIGLSAGDLSRVDRARVNYLWGGLISVIGGNDAATVGEYLELLQSGIADAVEGLIRRIGEDHGASLEAAGE